MGLKDTYLDSMAVGTNLEANTELARGWRRPCVCWCSAVMMSNSGQDCEKPVMWGLKSI